MDGLEFELKAVGALSVPERDSWRAFVAADPALRHPYFDLRYALAAADVAPGAGVAVVRRRGRPVGFLPFQRRGGVIQPLGAPLTDYHGVIAAPGERIALADLAARMGGRVFRFNGLVGGDAQPTWTMRRRLEADLSGGWSDWLSRRQADRGSVFKNLRRAERALARDLGPVRFTLGERDPAVLDHILTRKREQMERTGWPDIFGCGWTQALLHRLLASEDEDFGARLAVLRAGDRIVSAEIGLHGAGVRHLWFPIYEPDLRRYAPGQLMTLKTLEACAEQGLTRVDFGAGDESYKSTFADPAEIVFEGSAAAGPWRAAATRMLAAAVNADPARLGRVRNAVVRRLDVVTACEPDMGRRLEVLTRIRPETGRAVMAVTLLPIGM